MMMKATYWTRIDAIEVEKRKNSNGVKQGRRFDSKSKEFK
jgi:hypothetical protein